MKRSFTCRFRLEYLKQSLMCCVCQLSSFSVAILSSSLGASRSFAVGRRKDQVKTIIHVGTQEARDTMAFGETCSFLQSCHFYG